MYGPSNWKKGDKRTDLKDARTIEQRGGDVMPNVLMFLGENYPSLLVVVLVAIIATAVLKVFYWLLCCVEKLVIIIKSVKGNSKPPPSKRNEKDGKGRQSDLNRPSCKYCNTRRRCLRCVRRKTTL